MTVYLFIVYVAIAWCLFILFLIYLYKLGSFWVPGRPLEAPPSAEIQFSLRFSFVLSGGSHYDHPGGGGDLRGWPPHRSCGPRGTGHPSPILPPHLMQHFMLLVFFYLHLTDNQIPLLSIDLYTNQVELLHFDGRLHMIWHPRPYTLFLDDCIFDLSRNDL